MTINGIPVLTIIGLLALWGGAAWWAWRIYNTENALGSLLLGFGLAVVGLLLLTLDIADAREAISIVLYLVAGLFALIVGMIWLAAGNARDWGQYD